MTAAVPHILVVDDDASARLLMRAALRKFGYEVSLAACGEDALRQFRTAPFDLVMLDIDMPDMDGHEVCTALRAEADPLLPIVMVTGMDDVQSVDRAYSAGATDFVAKPMNWALIGHRVRYLLRGHQALLALRLANAHNAAILQAIPDLLFEIDLEGRFIDYRSPRSDVLTASVGSFIGRTVAEIFPPKAAQVCMSALQEANACGSSAGKQCELQLPAGSSWFELAVSRKDAGFGQHAHFIVLARDITERKQAEKKLYLAASVFTHSGEGIMITSPDGTIIDVNVAFTRITGYSRDEVLGKNPRLLKSGRQNKEFYATLWRSLLEEGQWHGEVWNRRKNGNVYPEMLNISTVRDTQASAQQYVALFSDITSTKEHQRQLEHVAHFDALTSLPNRVLLADRLQQAMAQTQRRGQHLAVAYLDLDGFKAINDDHGHEAGDRLLIALSSRMGQALREGDTLARMGGDEFVAVLLDLADVAASVPMLTRLLAAAAQPVQYGETLLQVSTSLGITFYPQGEDVDADQLLRQADQAMYLAKQAGKNRFHVFDAEQDRSVRGHHEDLEHIRRALSEQRFVLYYQPKVNMSTGEVIGAEALIRWQHPQRGLLPPAVFLPVIENHPLAVEVGEWVIATALTQMEIWHTAGLDIPVSVNVGARHLQQPNFVQRLREILAAHPQIKPACLELEVLETSALEDVAHVSRIIEVCQEIGVSFALDDFGTGYSSLSYLKFLPVNVLKIDQSFVRDMLSIPDDIAILEGVVGLASAFGRQVVAEGVETVEHGTMLLRLGCKLAQGYGIARPMPAHEMPGWSAAWRPDPCWKALQAVSRADLPVIFASVEHRAWIQALEAFLKDERETPPALDYHQCRVGLWLDNDGLARHGTHPGFATIQSLHQGVHALAAQLCECHAQGRKPEALSGLGQLHELRDALFDQLKVLVQPGVRQT